MISPKTTDITKMLPDKDQYKFSTLAIILIKYFT